LNKVLITGGSGLLGLNRAATLDRQSEVHLGIHPRGVTLKGTVASPIDVDSLDRTFCCFDLPQPDLVVNTAGLTSVESYEDNPSITLS
jgi:dTDP-4-dehydrorhamnose reductase